MSISERIQALVEYEGSQTKLANKAGLNNAAISRIINASSSTLRSDTLEAIVTAYPDLNARWLLTGQGAMWLDGKHAPATSPPPKNTAEQLRMLQRLTQLQEQRLSELEREIRERAPALARRLGLG